MLVFEIEIVRLVPRVIWKRMLDDSNLFRFEHIEILIGIADSSDCVHDRIAEVREHTPTLTGKLIYATGHEPHAKHRALAPVTTVDDDRIDVTEAASRLA